MRSMRFLLIAFLLSLSASPAMAELISVSCTYKTAHSLSNSFIVSLDSNRKIMTVTYQGSRGALAFIEQPGGSLVPQSYITIERAAGDILLIKANLKGGTPSAPKFLASLEMTLEKVPSGYTEYVYKGGGLYHNGQDLGQILATDLKGQLCRLLPTH